MKRDSWHILQHQYLSQQQQLPLVLLLLLLLPLVALAALVVLLVAPVGGWRYLYGEEREWLNGQDWA